MKKERVIFHQINDADNDFLLFSSKTLKRFGNMTEAFMLSHLVYLRDPFWVENLTNLSELYALKGDKDSADRISNEATLLTLNSKVNNHVVLSG